MFPTQRVHLKPELSIAQAFLNFFPPQKFLWVMERMVQGVGHDSNGLGSVVAGESEDAPETGVEFYMGPQDEIWVSDEEFFEIFTQALQAHLAEHPNDEAVVHTLIERGRAKWSGA